MTEFKNNETKQQFKIGDSVIFINIFNKLAGRISQILMNEQDQIIGYKIKAVDPTFHISTYEVPTSDVIKLVNFD